MNTSLGAARLEPECIPADGKDLHACEGTARYSSDRELLNLRMQPLLRKVLFPQPRRKQIDLCGRVTVLQNVDEVVVGVDAVKLAGDDQALHDADLASAQFGPAELQFLRPSGIGRRLRSKWCVSTGRSGSPRNNDSACSRACA